MDDVDSKAVARRRDGHLEPTKISVPAARPAAMTIPAELAYLRPLASIGVSKFNSRKSLIFNLAFTQVVDFHDISRYFSPFFLIGGARLRRGVTFSREIELGFDRNRTT